VLKQLEGASRAWKEAPMLVASLGRMEMGVSDRETEGCDILMVVVHLGPNGMLDEIQLVIYRMTLESDEFDCST